MTKFYPCVNVPRNARPVGPVPVPRLDDQEGDVPKRIDRWHAEWREAYGDGRLGDDDLPRFAVVRARATRFVAAMNRLLEALQDPFAPWAIDAIERLDAGELKEELGAWADSLSLMASAMRWGLAGGDRQQLERMRVEYAQRSMESLVGDASRLTAENRVAVVEQVAKALGVLSPAAQPTTSTSAAPRRKTFANRVARRRSSSARANR